MNAPLTRFEPNVPQTAASMRMHVNLIQEVMQAVMREGTHYGKIPGTPKPSLWKPGAEVLAATFHIAPSYRVEDLSGPDFIRYRVVCIGTHQGTGTVLGEGMGECSSLEEKYKWRKASGAREFDNTPEDRRRIKYGYDRDKRQEYEIRQVRAECADQANTILKMACKRAQVAMTLNVVAASDIFTQDIEDLPPELQPDDESGGEQQPAPKVEQPRSRSSAPAKSENGGEKDAPLTEGAKTTLKRALERAGRTEKDLLAAEFPAIDAMPFSRFQAAMDWVKKNPAT